MSETPKNLLRKIISVLSDCHHPHLNRCKPQGKGTSIMLDENGKKSLQGSQDRPVDHKGSLFFTLRIHEGEIKPFGKVKVELDSGALPRASEAVPDLQVNFGSVKCSPSFVQ